MGPTETEDTNGVVPNGDEIKESSAPDVADDPQGNGGEAEDASKAESQEEDVLYVTNIEENVDEDQLKQVFGKAGEVASIRFCKDNATNKPLGSAYVRYREDVRKEAAKAAQEALNNTEINGKPIAIQLCTEAAASSKTSSSVGNIFVKNLDLTIDSEALREAFSQFGIISSCKVATDVSGKPKGTGYINFEEEDAAKKAIENMNGTKLKENTITVTYFVRSDDRASRQSKFVELYVNRIPESVDETRLRQHFESIGTVTSAVIMKNREDPTRSKGFGFVTFEDSEAAAKAVETLNGSELEGAKLHVGRAIRKVDRNSYFGDKYNYSSPERAMRRIEQQQCSLYVKNLDESTRDEDLKEAFSEFGTVKAVHLLRESDGNLRGYGFIRFASPEEAARALQSGQGRTVRNKQVFLAHAQRRNDMRNFANFQGIMPMDIRNLPPYGMMMPPRSGMPFQTPMFYGPIPTHAGRGGPMMPYVPLNLPRGGGQESEGGTGAAGANVAGATAAGVAAGPGHHQGDSGYLGVPYGVYPMQMPITGPRYRGRGRVQSGRGRWHRPFRSGRPGNRGPAPYPEMIEPTPDRAPPPAHETSTNSNDAKPPLSEQQPPQYDPGNGGVDSLSAYLAAAPPQRQKQILGERLYPLILSNQKVGSNEELAAKITGMFIEMDNTELLVLLESQEQLWAKIDEALSVLSSSGHAP